MANHGVSKYREACTGCHEYVLPVLEWKIPSAISNSPLPFKSCPKCASSLVVNGLDREILADLPKPQSPAPPKGDARIQLISERTERLQRYLQVDEKRAESIWEAEAQPKHGPIRNEHGIAATSKQKRSHRVERAAQELADFSNRLMLFGCVLTIAVPLMAVLVILLYAFFAA